MNCTQPSHPYIPLPDLNTCGFCVTSSGRIFIELWILLARIITLPVCVCVSQILFPFLVSSLPRSKATPRYIPSPHYVLTESIISGPWRSNDSRPSPDFSPQLRDKICLQSGEIIHCVMNIVQNPQPFRTELRYKRQLCGESCGPGFISMSPVIKKIFGAHVLLSGE